MLVRRRLAAIPEVEVVQRQRRNRSCPNYPVFPKAGPPRFDDSGIADNLPRSMPGAKPRETGPAVSGCPQNNYNEKHEEEMMKVVFQNLPKFALALGITALMTACASQPTVPETAEDAVAALEAGNVVAANEEGGEGDEEVVCRSEIRTGTNFRRRTCRTVAEWNARSAAQRAVVEQRAENERDQEGVDNANGGF
jgi:hypothetical protein